MKKITTPINQIKEKRNIGMYKLMEISAEEQRNLDMQWGQGIAKAMIERKTSNKETPKISTRKEDTSLTDQFKINKKSEPFYQMLFKQKENPIFIHRENNLDRKLSIRKGKMVKGLKPVKGSYEYLHDKYAETRKTPKQGKPMPLTPWKAPELKTQKESNYFFVKERINKTQVFNEDISEPNITPSKILAKQKFKKTEIKLGSGEADTFGRKFERSPINSPTRDITKNRTNIDKLIEESKEQQEKKDKNWIEQRRKIDEENRKTKSGQILEPPEPKPEGIFSQPTPEKKGHGESQGGTKNNPKNNLPVIIPPTPRERKKPYLVSNSIYAEYEQVLHSNRPVISARSTSSLGTRSLTGISTKQSTPQKLNTNFKLDTKISQKLSTPQKTKIFEKQISKEAQREKQQQKERSILKIPEINKPQPKQKSPQKFKEKPKLSFKTPEIFIKPPETVFLLPPPPEPKKPRKGRTRKGKPSENFIGASSQRGIEGFFRREDVIYGRRSDKLVGKKEVFLPEFGLGFSNKKKLKI